MSPAILGAEAGRSLVQSQDVLYTVSLYLKIKSGERERERRRKSKIRVGLAFIRPGVVPNAEKK